MMMPPPSRRRAPRRVAFVDHTAKIGGGEIALFNLVRHLDRSRYVPLVILFSHGPLATKLQEAGVETHVLPVAPDILEMRKDTIGARTLLLRPLNILRSLAHAFRITRFIRRQRVVLVHTNSLKADIIGGIAARLAGKPLIWHIRDRIDEDYLPRPVVVVFRWLCRILPDGLIGNSLATLQTLQLPARIPRDAIPSGIELAPSPIAEQPPTARSARCVGLVGRIARWKGQDIFVRAAATVHARHPDVRFQIIGAALFDESAYAREVHALVDSLGLADCVEFTGFRDDVPKLIANLQILVHASVTGEPFGQVIVEGMAAGKPVVATNGGGVPEIVVDGVTGVLVPMGDAGALAEAICTLLDDPEKSRLMGQAGLQRVYQSFTIGATASRIADIYDQMFDGNPRRVAASPES
jgi:glycosyltransferase involved in cell wall biosynthesis